MRKSGNETICALVLSPNAHISQEPGTPSQSPTEVARTQVFQLSPRVIGRKASESTEQPGLKAVTLRQDLTLLSKAQPYCATVPAKLCCSSFYWRPDCLHFVVVVAHAFLFKSIAKQKFMKTFP